MSLDEETNKAAEDLEGWTEKIGNRDFKDFTSMCFSYATERLSYDAAELRNKMKNGEADCEEMIKGLILSIAGKVAVLASMMNGATAYFGSEVDVEALNKVNNGVDAAKKVFESYAGDLD